MSSTREINAALSSNFAKQSAEVERLRTAWNEGLASGAPQPLDMNKTKAKARAQMASNGKADDASALF